MEETLSTAFKKVMVVAIADFMDDCSGQDKKAHQTADQSQPEIPKISKSSSQYCSLYDHSYWLGGGCLRETAASSLAVITECATMKTDNTTEPITAMVMVQPPTLDEEAYTTNSHSHTHSYSHNIISSSAESSPNNKRVNDDSISSSEMNTNANADIISQYYQNCFLHSNSDPDSESLCYTTDYKDYSDPMNSILVEDHTDLSKNSRHSNNSGMSRSQTHKRSNRKMDCSNFLFDKSNNTTMTSETEEEDWFSASTSSASSSWCGGYPSMLMYNYKDDGDDTQEKQRQQEEPNLDYYAGFNSQRQYAFDEEDDRNSRSVLEGPLTSARVIFDRNNDNNSRATVSDGNSVVTSVSSVQSFMVINRPHSHKNAAFPSTPSTRKLRKQSRSSVPRIVSPEHGHRRQKHNDNNHLHQLIASPGASTASPSGADDTVSISDDHALTQSLMQKLQKHLPYGKRGDSFWLQYSLIRDGASLDSLLGMVHKDSNLNNSNHNNNVCSILAIETVEGEVFGAFLTETWRISNRKWFGGGQSFLWTTSSGSNSDSKVKVFPYSFENSYVQLCDRDRLLVGGGDGGDLYERHCYGFGLALEKDLWQGSSCPCTTFQSPSLSKLHSDGSTFEIRNLEVWTVKPCLSVLDNPSEGRVRVHKKERRSNRKNRSKSNQESSHPKGRRPHCSERM